MKDLEIIIPAYNAHDTIETTLNSIAIQKELPNYHVTIVNDSGKDYQEIIAKYKNKIKVDEITTPFNGGPGLARQFALDNTDSKYVLFIDADDEFYDEKSISLLYNKINQTKVDIVVSNFIFNKNGIKEVKEKSTVWFHGKIYNKSFIKKNNIMFNNSRLNEDNGFNGLFFLLNPVVIWLNKITYIYNDNKNSLTRNKEYKIDGLESYTYNINWVIEEAEKRHVDKVGIKAKALEGLHVLYKTYVDNYNDESINKIIIWSKKIYEKYIKYKDIQLEDDQSYENNIISFGDFLNKIKESI